MRRWTLLAWLLLGPFPAWAAATTGPTIRLDNQRNDSAATSVSDFMYFIALISPAPVFIGSSPGSAQTARLVSSLRKSTRTTFQTTCEFQFAGAGIQESIFDLTPMIRRNERQLKAGGVLARQLESIVVNGAGLVVMEVRGSVSNDVRTVNEVRARFNPHGQESFVSITLCDVRWINGRFCPTNEFVARVNTLTFRREPGIPKMEITVASIKDKAAGDSLWQNLKGSIAGAAVNLFIPPLVVEKDGNLAMLDFGAALAAGSSSFIFPKAKNLLASRAPAITLLTPASP